MMKKENYGVNWMLDLFNSVEESTWIINKNNN